MKMIGLVAVLASGGVVAVTAGSAPPTVSFVAARAVPGKYVEVRVAGVRPGRARLQLSPGRVLLDPVFRVNRRRTARFWARVPNVPPGDYKLAAARNRRILARSTRSLHIVDPPPGGRGCESSVFGELGSGWEQSSLKAGPLFFVGMARGISAEEVARSKRVIKVLVLVENGAVVTLRIADADRGGVALDYSPPFAARRVADGMPAMTFRACKPGDWRPHTQFNGSFVLDRPRCAHLEAHVHGRAEPIPVAISFGAPC
jgi:hypothetical protein